MFTSFFPPLILISALACGSAAQSYPATVEIDLVFPRNETFAPAPVMPLVFAVQNPIATVALPYEIEWSMREYGGGLYFGNTFRPSWANYTTDPNPLYVYTWTHFLNSSSEGVFNFVWILHSGNCSGLPSATAGHLGGMSTNSNVMFTLKKGAQQQSLVPGAGACPMAGPTFNVTRTLPVANIVDFGFDTTCAVLADEQPAPNPCAVQVNKTVASSISSKVTSSACTTPAVPFGTALPALTTGCPPPSTSTSAAVAVAVQSHLGGLAASGVAVFTASLLGLVAWGLVLA